MKSEKRKAINPNVYLRPLFRFAEKEGKGEEAD